MREQTSRADDVLEEMLGDVDIDCTERVVEKVHDGVLVHGPRQTHPVSLPAAQVDALQPGDSKVQQEQDDLALADRRCNQELTRLTKN